VFDLVLDNSVLLLVHIDPDVVRFTICEAGLVRMVVVVHGLDQLQEC
jgi:hypothetical protein